MLELSPLETATKASASLIPASSRTSRSNPMPTISRAPSPGGYAWNASGFLSMIATSLPPSRSAFESSDPTRPQPMIITRIRGESLPPAPRRRQKEGRPWISHQRAVVGEGIERPANSCRGDHGDGGTEGPGSERTKGESWPRGRDGPGKEFGPAEAGPNDEDGSGGPTTGGSRRPPGCDSEDGFLWKHLRDERVRDA